MPRRLQKRPRRWARCDVCGAIVNGAIVNGLRVAKALGGACRGCVEGRILWACVDEMLRFAITFRSSQRPRMAWSRQAQDAADAHHTTPTEAVVSTASRRRRGSKTPWHVAGGWASGSSTHVTVPQGASASGALVPVDRTLLRPDMPPMRQREAVKACSCVACFH